MGSELAIRKVGAGEVIFRQGSPAEEMYVVRSGTVRIYRERDGKETTLATLKQGDFLGEMALLTHSTRAASAQAVGDVEMRVVGESDLTRLARDPIVRDLLQTLSNRLRAMDEAVEKASSENTAVRQGLSHVHLVRHWFT
jgi:CRP/FNR family transcriptional regulator, cyclic AMP receptor protein